MGPSSQALQKLYTQTKFNHHKNYGHYNHYNYKYKKLEVEAAHFGRRYLAGGKKRDGRTRRF